MSPFLLSQNKYNSNTIQVYNLYNYGIKQSLYFGL